MCMFWAMIFFRIVCGNVKDLCFLLETEKYFVCYLCFLQDKGTPDIVLKAMGRAINKTVNIAEIIKV